MSPHAPVTVSHPIQPMVSPPVQSHMLVQPPRSQSPSMQSRLSVPASPSLSVQAAREYSPARVSRSSTPAPPAAQHMQAIRELSPSPSAPASPARLSRASTPAPPLQVIRGSATISPPLPTTAASVISPTGYSRTATPLPALKPVHVEYSPGLSPPTTPAQPSVSVQTSSSRVCSPPVQHRVMPPRASTPSQPLLLTRTPPAAQVSRTPSQPMMSPHASLSPPGSMRVPIMSPHPSGSPPSTVRVLSPLSSPIPKASPQQGARSPPAAGPSSPTMALRVAPPGRQVSSPSHPQASRSSLQAVQAAAAAVQAGSFAMGAMTPSSPQLVKRPSQEHLSLTRQPSSFVAPAEQRTSTASTGNLKQSPFAQLPPERQPQMDKPSQVQPPSNTEAAPLAPRPKAKVPPLRTAWAAARDAEERGDADDRQSRSVEPKPTEHHFGRYAAAQSAFAEVPAHQRSRVSPHGRTVGRQQQEEAICGLGVNVDINGDHWAHSLRTGSEAMKGTTKFSGATRPPRTRAHESSASVRTSSLESAQTSTTATVDTLPLPDRLQQQSSCNSIDSNSTLRHTRGRSHEPDKGPTPQRMEEVSEPEHTTEEAHVCAQASGQTLLSIASSTLSQMEHIAGTDLLRAAMGHIVPEDEAMHPQRVHYGNILLDRARTALECKGVDKHSDRLVVERLFFDSIPEKHIKILDVEQVIQPALLKQFCRQLVTDRVCVEAAFHGTRVENLDAIVAQGLSTTSCQTGAYGTGAYVGTHAGVAHQYADPDESGVRHMCLVLVVVGHHAIRGHQGEAPHHGEVAMDHLVNPTQYCFVDAEKLLVSHIVTYKVTGGERHRIGGGWEDPFQQKLSYAVSRAAKRRHKGGKR
eukprot:gnl/TRDRNA2_/TRDRNA2_168471_c2_seq1.p1 gnl/TRDRNA2_/TRDRNA2_168471_c2~~gnl/TRDRNA2_/TRDRNA2_168471_c2_seq1.p1  ORF type:complete len:898 (-),score=91.25 gnl/TRDRNA2_/TRDRNA2_168471_c2_seq1:115-2700(-)